MAEYNFSFDWARVTTIGKVKVLAEQVIGAPGQDAINAAVAAYIDAHPGALSPLSPEVKAALRQLAQKVAYIDENGQTYYNDLDAALGPADLVSITAQYTQPGTVYDTASLDSLKADLVVTANYDDGTSATVTGYTLSGTLTPGTSTITVTYESLSTTFTVIVTSSLLYSWDFTQSLTDTVEGITATLSGATQSAAGLYFSAGGNYATVGDVLAFNRTVEIDYTDAASAFGNVNGVWFWTDASTGTHSGFGYHYSTTAANNKYGFFSADIGHWGYASSYGKTSLNGSGTIKFTVDAAGKIDVYKDGTNMNIRYNSAKPYFTNAVNCQRLILGSPYSSYPGFYNVYITGIRVYEGVR